MCPINSKPRMEKCADNVFMINRNLVLRKREGFISIGDFCQRRRGQPPDRIAWDMNLVEEMEKRTHLNRLKMMKKQMEVKESREDKEAGWRAPKAPREATECT